MKVNWGATATIVAAFIGLFAGGVPSIHRIVENWSPTAKYRALRLLRSHELKVKEMNSASSEAIRQSFAFFINDDNCKIEQMKFDRELDNYRKNLKINEESAPPPESTMYEFSSTLILLLIFLRGLSAIVDWLKDSPISSFILAVLALLSFLVFVWALLIQGIKKLYWKIIIRRGFRSFLMPFFETTSIYAITQREFQHGLASFDGVYGNKQIVSLKKASSRALIAEGSILFIAAIVDTFTSKFSKLTNYCVYGIFMLLLLASLAVFFCCSFTYCSETQRLIYLEKKKYSWYNPRIDMNNGGQSKLTECLNAFSFWWLGKTTDRLKSGSRNK